MELIKLKVKMMKLEDRGGGGGIKGCGGGVGGGDFGDGGGIGWRRWRW